ncbi:MBL fold metallo-hydrolase [Oceanobacter mangrovi]|uniref:MBL fold metallo-hydrolase n=1 Tax=Oceanobacter mangrovi TaxID=2862510 RepID=UPI001C8E11DF|nr:MBL fold metallo-hydrolase [Oceanobacter mangrovi]
MQYQLVPVTAFMQNCTIFMCEETRKAAIVDPGGDVAKIEAALQQMGASAEKILLTHGHLDHVGASAELASKLNIPIIGPHKGDEFWLQALPQQAQMFGFAPATSFSPDQWLEDGDTVTVGNVELQVIHTPGHTPGHVVFLQPQQQLAQVGDVIFNGSIGRTDFPQGNHADLISSIRDKLFPLGDEIRFIPGHGPESTFGAERRSNPFVADRRG